MLKQFKTSLHAIFAIFLLFILSANIYAENERETFSELPDSYSIFEERLLKLNSELDFCKQNNNCNYLNDYSRVIKSHISTLLYGTRDYYYIQYYYGLSSYRYIRMNTGLIDLHFDIYLTKELMDFNNGILLSENNGFTKEQVNLIYSEYVIKIGYEKLFKLREACKTDKQRAIVEYYIYSMFSDYRLYSSD